MDKIIEEINNNANTSKDYLLDTIIPPITKFGVIWNRPLHSRLLKILMKGLNLILKVSVKQEDNKLYRGNSKNELLTDLDKQ